MTNEDKRLIIESVGLEWIDYESCDRTCGGICIVCDTPQLDPLNPADMAKIWTAMKIGDKDDFLLSLWDEVGRDYLAYAMQLIYAPNTAQAMLEYFKEKTHAQNNQSRPDGSHTAM